MSCADEFACPRCQQLLVDDREIDKVQAKEAESDGYTGPWHD